MTNTTCASKQLYVLPTPDGWALVSYGDEIVPDDEIVPLPLTAAVTYDEAISFVAALPMAAGAMIDGWIDDDQLAAMEPELAARLAR